MVRSGSFCTRHSINTFVGLWMGSGFKLSSSFLSILNIAPKCIHELSFRSNRAVTLSKTSKSFSRVLMVLPAVDKNWYRAGFSQCRKNKTNYAITLANHYRRKHRNEPIRIRSQHLQSAPGVGERVPTSHDWIGFCFSLVEKRANVVNQSQSVTKENQSNHELFWTLK